MSSVTHHFEKRIGYNRIGLGSVSCKLPGDERMKTRCVFYSLFSKRLVKGLLYLIYVGVQMIYIVIAYCRFL